MHNNDDNGAYQTEGYQSSAEKKAKKPFLVRPSQYAACILLADGSLSAGGLLYQIVLFSNGKGLKDEKGIKGWLAMSHAQWHYLTGFSRHQMSDAVKKLKAKKLIQTRRRRLHHSDPAPLAWYRLKESTKSAITEIMAAEGISAFGENHMLQKPANADNNKVLLSGFAASLEEMILTKNDTEENVVIEKTTIAESQSKKVKKNKEGKKKESKKDWFNSVMFEVLKDTAITPEPYTNNNVVKLERILEYLEGNPGQYFEFCFSPKPSIYAVREVMCNWSDFTEFAIELFKAFNMPLTPQFFSISHQLKAIPDYIKYRFHNQRLADLFIAEGFEHKTVELTYDNFVKLMTLPADQHEGFLIKIMKAKLQMSHSFKTMKDFK